MYRFHSEHDFTAGIGEFPSSAVKSSLSDDTPSAVRFRVDNSTARVKHPQIRRSITFLFLCEGPDRSNSSKTNADIRIIRSGFSLRKGMLRNSPIPKYSHYLGGIFFTLRQNAPLFLFSQVQSFPGPLIGCE